MFRCSEPPGILLIHGFGGNRSEVRPLTDHLRGLGCEVVSVLLPGHSDQHREMDKEEARASRWINEVRRQLSDLRRRHDRIVVIGFSMGGLLAIRAVSELKPDGLDHGGEEHGSEMALVTINAPVWFWNVPQMVRNVKRGGAEEFRRYRRGAGGKPAVALMEFLRLLWTTGPELRKVSCSALVVQACDDDIVWPASSVRILRKMGGPRRLVMVPEGGHQVLTSNASNMVCEEVENFIWGNMS